MVLYLKEVTRVEDILEDYKKGASLASAWNHTVRVNFMALDLVKSLCNEVAKLEDILEVEKIFKAALRKAVSVGIPELIEEIVLSYPSALFFVSLGDLNIITYAILNHRECVFNLVHQTSWKYIYGVDNSLNNVLHLVARLGHEQQINLKASVAGAVLQMQREMQWFKGVKILTPPSDREGITMD
ncbi:uncharacterized protein LOC131327806 [Rhododendron vialii]|uniref:uncharacterized protein LOC131327806 n=1 Tax=Rhododendron vialii TaxID=182163 RepID=UPI00265EAB5C|nr:uncharacterized protein LOC131327806 [Rhododendron vialii]